MRSAPPNWQNVGLEWSAQLGADEYRIAPMKSGPLTGRIGAWRNHVRFGTAPNINEAMRLAEQDHQERTSKKGSR